MDYRIWYKDGENINFEGKKIFVKEYPNPEKPIILFSHGFPTSSYDWHKMWPELHKFFHLIAFDYLGFGYSDKPYPYDYTLEEQADITEYILYKKGIEECFVVAHDYAVSVVQELLARRIENPNLPKFKKIVLLNGGLFPETHQARPIQKILLSPVGKWANMAFGKNAFGKTLRQIFGPSTPPKEEEIDAYWTIINHKNGKRVFHRTINYINDRKNNRERWVNALIHTDVSIRLVNGPKDPISGIHMVERYKELIPNPDCVLLDNIGHYPNLEAPYYVNLEVLKFFQGNN
ncbi:MAG: alpha/beta hydrolase [Saprospiraceae bacterium]